MSPPESGYLLPNLSGTAKEVLEENLFEFYSGCGYVSLNGEPEIGLSSKQKQCD